MMPKADIFLIAKVMGAIAHLRGSQLTACGRWMLDQVGILTGLSSDRIAAAYRSKSRQTGG